MELIGDGIKPLKQRQDEQKRLEAPASSRQEPWHSRGYLPHFDKPGLIQSITFRLADSLPTEALARLTHELADLPESCQQIEREKHIRALLDQGHGQCHLKNATAAQIVQDALIHFDNQRYRLIAWCIMPNHAHVAIETKDGHPLEKVVHSWKSFTANEINKALGLEPVPISGVPRVEHRWRNPSQGHEKDADGAVTEFAQIMRKTTARRRR